MLRLSLTSDWRRWCMAGGGSLAARRTAANSIACRLEFFGIHHRALLGSNGRLRRISGDRYYVDLDRALGKEEDHLGQENKERGRGLGGERKL